MSFFHPARLDKGESRKGLDYLKGLFSVKSQLPTTTWTELGKPAQDLLRQQTRFPSGQEVPTGLSRESIGDYNKSNSIDLEILSEDC